LPDSTNTLTGWRVEMGQPLSNEQMRVTLALLIEELNALIATSDSQESIRLDSQMWQRLLWSDDRAKGDTAVMNEVGGLA